MVELYKKVEMYMRYSRKKKLIIISCLSALVLSIGLGFAAFSTTLKINGNAKVSPTDSNFKVIFADSAEQGGVYTQLPVIPTSNPGDLEKYDGEIATEGTKISNLGGVFTEDGESITYDFFVYNVGKYDAYLTNIDYTYKEGTYSKRTCTNISSSESTLSESCNDIIIKVVLAGETYIGSTIFTDHILAKGEYEPIQIVIEYPEGSDLPDGEMDVEFSDIELTFGTIDEVHPQPEAALMANGSGVFRFNTITRNQVESIETVNSIDIPYNAIDSCDASANQDESVIAWYTDEDKNGLYELYISSEGTIKVTRGEYLFSGYTKAKSIDLQYFDTSEVTSMEGMFYGCTELENLNINNFDGTKVESIEVMFYGCKSIQKLEFNNFQAPNLNNINRMFKSSEIKVIEMNNFYGGKIKSMYELQGENQVSHLYSLLTTEEIYMKNLNLPEVTTLSEMFYYCPKLKILDISGINTPKNENLQAFIWRCELLIDLRGEEDLDTANVKYMGEMFYLLKSITELDVSTFDTSSAIDMAGMFSGCNALETIDLSSFNTSKVVSMAQMFRNCNSLKNLNVNNFDGTNVESIELMFNGCKSMNKLEFNNFNAPKLNNMFCLFAYSEIKIIEMNNFYGGKVKDLYTFKGESQVDRLSSLKTTEEIYMKNFSLPEAISISEIFFNSLNLKILDLSGLSIPNLEYATSIFHGCNNLKELRLKDINLSNKNYISILLNSTPSKTTIVLEDIVDNRTFMSDNFSNFTNITWI